MAARTFIKLQERKGSFKLQKDGHQNKKKVATSAYEMATIAARAIPKIPEVLDLPTPAREKKPAESASPITPRAGNMPTPRVA